MLALGLILTVGATPVTDKLAPYRGQPVLSVTVDAHEDEDQTFLRSLIDIQPGFLLSTVDVQQAIKRLYALGRFANVYVSAERLSGVVLVTFHLRPLLRMASLEIRGLELADESALRARLKVRPGAELDRRTPDLIVTRTREHLATVGFPEAQVRMEALDEFSDAPERTLRMRIIEGPPVHVDAIRFEGQPRVVPQVLRGIVDVEPGDILDRDRLASDRKLLLTAYVDHGFLTARVGPARVVIEAEQNIVIFDIEAGDRMAIDLTGNRVVTTATLMTLWPEDTPRIASGSLLEFANRITEYYRRRGYADVRVEPHGFRDAKRGIIRYLFTITENKPIRVSLLEFVGAEAIPPETLAEQVRAVLAEQLATRDDFQQITDAELEIAAFGVPAWGNRPRQPRYQSTVPPHERWVPALYQQALNGILAVYNDRGYLSATVGEPEVERHNDEIAVRVRVHEGPQTVIRSIRFANNVSIAAEKLLDEVASAPREVGAGGVALAAPFSQSAVEAGRIAIVRRYRDAGYLYAKVFSETQVTEDSRFAEVAYRVEEGPEVRIRSVLIRGNRVTSTETIRSRISFEEGDLYRLDQAVRDKREIGKLGVFSSVRVELIDEERPAERKDLVAEVTERQRQRIDTLFGFSTADGFRFGVTYGHNNVFGNATTMRLEARFNRQFFFELYAEHEQTMKERYGRYTLGEQFSKGLERDLSAGIRSRRLQFLPYGTALRLDLSDRQDNTIPYSIHEAALTGGIEFFPIEPVTVILEPQVSVSDLECPAATVTGTTTLGAADTQSCVSQAQSDLSRAFEEGLRVTFKIGPSLTVDLRDNDFSPSKGIWINAEATFAVGIGEQVTPEIVPPPTMSSSTAPPWAIRTTVDPQDPVTLLRETVFKPFSFAKVEGTVIAYIPILGAVLTLTAKVGHATALDGGVPVDELFFIGGRDTVRGFVEDTLAPEDSCTTDVDTENCNVRIPIVGGTPLSRGGHTFALLRTELRIPITESFSLDLFADLGNLWWDVSKLSTLRPRVGLGAGLRYDTAIGALVADFGFNPDPRFGETSFEPHFSVSRF